MTKTPEELARARVLAREWVFHRREISGEDETPGIGHLIDKELAASYLAGYAEAKPKWISAAEKLPELYTRVLIACNLDTSEPVHIAKLVEDEINNTVFWKANFFTLPAQYPVHWMPLPEPLKAKD